MYAYFAYIQAKAKMFFLKVAVISCACLIGAVSSAAVEVAEASVTRMGTRNLRETNSRQMALDPTQASFNRRGDFVASKTEKISIPVPAPPIDYNLKSAGSFSFSDSGVLFWAAAGVLAAWAANSLFSATGTGFFGTMASRLVEQVTGRSDIASNSQWMPSAERLNVLAAKVYAAIDSWKAKQI